MNLLRALVGNHWLISPEYVSGALPFISAMIERGDDSGFASLASASSSYAIVGSASMGSQNQSIANAQPGSIAVIEINGPLMKNDQNCGPVGTATIGQWVKQADANPNIDGIILDMDSPGGSADGTESLANIVAGTKKKVVALVNGTVASAAYWIASGADEIIAVGETSIIGSIGTMMSYADFKPILEKAGVRFHQINATDSVDKNKVMNDLLGGTEEGYQSYRNTILDPLNNVFTSAVTKNRDGKLDLSKENVLTGKVYFSKKALKAGLIDKIGTMDTAIQSIRNSNPKKMSNISAQSLPLLCATLGFAEGFESNEEGVHLNEESLQAIENALAVGNTSAEQVVELQASIQTQTTANTELQTQNQTLQNRVEELTQQLEESQNGMAHRGTTIQANDAAEETPSKVKYVDDGSQALLDKYLNK